MSTVAAALRVAEYDLTVYRRTWRGSLIISFISPLLFLGAMGLGLGGLVNRSAGGVQGVPYLEFLAPGLMAATAMQTAAGECSFPVMGKVYWQRIYDSMLATPLGVTEIVVGEMLWLSVRITLVALTFLAVMVVFGLVHSPAALLTLPAAVLTGVAVGMPVMAFTITVRGDTALSVLFRFVIMPLFLFSGTFFPLDRLPLALRVLAWISPLTHGVVLTRGLALGSLTFGTAMPHVAILVALLVVGVMAARITMSRRLLR